MHAIIRRCRSKRRSSMMRPPAEMDRKSLASPRVVRARGPDCLRRGPGPYPATSSPRRSRHRLAGAFDLDHRTRSRRPAVAAVLPHAQSRAQRLVPPADRVRDRRVPVVPAVHRSGAPVSDHGDRDARRGVDVFRGAAAVRHRAVGVRRGRPARDDAGALSARTFAVRLHLPAAVRADVAALPAQVSRRRPAVAVVRRDHRARRRRLQLHRVGDHDAGLPGDDRAGAGLETAHVDAHLRDCRRGISLAVAVVDSLGGHATDVRGGGPQSLWRDRRSRIDSDRARGLFDRGARALGRQPFPFFESGRARDALLGVLRSGISLSDRRLYQDDELDAARRRLPDAVHPARAVGHGADGDGQAGCDQRRDFRGVLARTAGGGAHRPRSVCERSRAGDLSCSAC